jgi:hypothetical protein
MAVASAPVPQAGAPCGVVDVLDFPLDPPDAERASGGQGFGQYRSRYNKYHAGEDWRAANRSRSLGMPVHSIGHGTVTYAAPLGWGADKGVVIVRHVFADGSTLLSFYGHLDPDSVVLRVGACVARGDVVGKIGRPRTSPHLHFEIRTHMPTEPGPGYWPVDPTRVGWKPPSQTIWQSRVSAAPGVQWMRPAVPEGIKGVGLLDDGTFVTIQDDKLVGIDVLDGSVRWTQPGTASVHDAVVDTERSLIYTASILGVVEAFPLPGAQGDSAGAAFPSEPVWRIELDVGIFPTMRPLPGGSVAVASRNRMFGLSAEGELLWERGVSMWALDWALANEQLILSGMSGSTTLWTVDEHGVRAWDTEAVGLLAVAGDYLLALGNEGIYRLDPRARSAELVYALPNGMPGYGDILALPDGSALAVHKDVLNSSLVMLNPDGSLRWRRSIPSVVAVERRLLALGDRAYLVSAQRTTSLAELSVFEIGLDDATLTRVFRGGSRSPIPAETWTSVVGDDRLLIGIEGMGTILLDVRQASEAVAEATDSQ